MLQRIGSQLRGQWMGALALFLVLAGGGAFAAFDPVGNDGDIDGCFEKKTGDLDLLKGKKCGKGEKPVTWSQDGPPGEPGQQGQPGDQGPPGPATGPAGGDLAGNYPDPQIAAGAVTEAKLGCGQDPNQQMVKVGSVCIDTYEASVWDSPTEGTQLTTEAQIDAACPNNGQPAGGAGCANFYARSVPGVEPARRITWFQAQQALANSAKQLPTNAEWQMAVSGTPDSTGCNVSTFVVANTGANAGCVSRFGAFDMVGNVSEWVGDWDEQADGCANWPAEYGADLTCFGGGTPSRFPGALIRGGIFVEGSDAGPFAVAANGQPSLSVSSIGFRGAR